MRSFSSPYTFSGHELPFKFPVASPVGDRTVMLPPQLHFLLALRILSANDLGLPATMVDSSDGFLAFSSSSSSSSGCRRDVTDFSARQRGITLREAPFDQNVSMHHMMRATKTSEKTPTGRRVRRLDTWKHVYQNAARNASVLETGSIFILNVW